MLRLILDWQRARISRETVVPLGLAFQITFNAVYISPKTPEAVTIKVMIPTTPRHRMICWRHSPPQLVRPLRFAGP
jgi:hypothetical protein